MSPKAHSSKTNAKKSLGKEVATLQKRVHNLKLRRDVRAYTGTNQTLGDIPRPIADSLLPHIPPEYSPQEILAPLSRLRGKVSELGLRWAIETLDPCGVPFTSPGIPDYSTGTRHVKTLRFGDTISAPPNLGSPETGDTWDLMIMTLPYVEIPFLHLKKKSSDPWPSTDTIAGVAAMLRTNFLTNQGSGGLVEVNNPSSPGSFWMPPEYAAFWTTQTLTPTGSLAMVNQYSAVRPVSRGITTELVGPSLFKGGRVYSGQIRPNFLEPTSDFTIGQLSYDGSVPDGQIDNKPGRRSAIFLPPLGPEYIVEGDPLYQERDANDGDYNVCRTYNTTGVCDLLSTSKASAVCIGSEEQLTLGTWANDQGIPGAVVMWWSTTTPLIGMPLEGLNTSVVYYTGLNLTQSVRVKYRGAVEGVPRLGGPYVELSKVAVEADGAAVQLVADIVNTLPHSYPAGYNDMGGLLGVIGTVMKHAGMPLLQGLGAAGIPILSPVLSILHGIGQSVFGL
jgi:hypothetical protein